MLNLKNKMIFLICRCHENLLSNSPIRSVIIVNSSCAMQYNNYYHDIVLC